MFILNEAGTEYFKQPRLKITQSHYIPTGRTEGRGLFFGGGVETATPSPTRLLWCHGRVCLTDSWWDVEEESDTLGKRGR